MLYPELAPNTFLKHCARWHALCVESISAGWLFSVTDEVHRGICERQRKKTENCKKRYHIGACEKMLIDTEKKFKGSKFSSLYVALLVIP